MKIKAYHTSRTLFWEFDESKWDSSGDFSLFINKHFNSGALYFSERPIPYYPNNFVYKVELDIKNPYFTSSGKPKEGESYDAIIVDNDKFSNGSAYGEIIVPSRKQVKMLAISCNKNFSPYVAMHKWSEENGYDNSWFEIFLKEFEQNCITIE